MMSHLHTQKLRSLVLLSMLAVILFIGNVNTASAHHVVIQPQPIRLGCYFQGDYYPSGTVLKFQLTETLDVTMTCKPLFKVINGVQRLVYDWVYS